MLDAGANVSMLDYLSKHSVLHIIANRRHTNFLELISMVIKREGIDINGKDHSNKTALHYAAYRGHQNIALMLLTNGCNVNLKDSNMKTPLHHAIENGAMGVIEHLIDYGANIKYLNTYTKENPLHFAIKQNCQVIEDMIKLLVDKGVDIDAQDYILRTPLHIAIEDGNIDIALLLIKLGADVNLQDCEMKTPLHYTAEIGVVSLIENLIDHGANINVPDCSHNTPLFIAHDLKDGEVVQLLQSRALKKKCYKHQPIMFNSSLHFLSKIAVSKY